MSVWFAIPSARPDGGTIPLWRERGYKVAVCVDEGGGGFPVDILESIMPYPGYAVAVNHLVRMILEQDPAAEWIVTGGDDTQPDLNHTPEQIARECTHYFSVLRATMDTFLHGNAVMELTTFGVMQPTGDRFANGSIDRIAGSPWVGREFCQRMYGGKGPLFDGYQHMFEDEELQEVATKLGVFWQRPDLIHLHHHFMRKSPDLNSPAVQKPIPPHLVKWNSRQHWNESKALFQSRKAAGFPGHEPLPVEVCA